MKKHTILITGAGSGIGRASAVSLAKRGHKVIATCKYLEQVAFFDEFSNLDIESIKLDILNPKDRNKIFNYKFDRFISNAGIGDSGAISEVNTATIERVFKTNVIASIDLIQLVIKKWTIEKIQDSKIIVIGSLVGKVALPFLGPYVISKFAIEAYCECLRFELKLIKEANIKISLVEPGSYATGFNKNNMIRMYNFMKNGSYYSNISNKIFKYQNMFWNITEKKNIGSIVKIYTKAVESPSNKFRYSAPLTQSLIVKLLQIFPTP